MRTVAQALMLCPKLRVHELVPNSCWIDMAPKGSARADSQGRRIARRTMRVQTVPVEPLPDP
eukprot:9805759-Alexandrium_andersonii.AAC.1